MYNKNLYKLKTELISSESIISFEQSLNECIKDKFVLDIQYKPVMLPLYQAYAQTDTGTNVTATILYQALVIYKGV